MAVRSPATPPGTGTKAKSAQYPDQQPSRDPAACHGTEPQEDERGERVHEPDTLQDAGDPDGGEFVARKAAEQQADQHDERAAHQRLPREFPRRGPGELTAGERHHE